MRGGVEVWIDNRKHSSTGQGLLVLLGTKRGDSEELCPYLVDKTLNLRIFDDHEGKMNRSVLDIAGEIMVISQFTLYANCRKGRRPSWNNAQESTEAERLYNKFIELMRESGLIIQSGSFGARMDLRFNNYGPVTIALEHE